MQRLNNPTDAQRLSADHRSPTTGHRTPLGAAFFLFLGLTMIPVSLKAAGVNVSFSPRLSAAVDAWNQISEVFGRSYQPGAESELASLRSSDNDVPTTTDNGGCPQRLVACARDAEALPLNFPEAPSTIVLNGFSSREVHAEAHIEAHIKVTQRASPNRSPVKQAIAREAFKTTLERGARALDASGTIKFETAREEFVKSIERQVLERSLGQRGVVVPFPTSLRVLIRMKPSIAPTARRTAECKVRAAFADAVRAETRQETPNTATSSLDNCDL
jgi:hypothetical protein